MLEGEHLAVRELEELRERFDCEVVDAVAASIDIDALDEPVLDLARETTREVGGYLTMRALLQAVLEQLEDETALDLLDAIACSDWGYVIEQIGDVFSPCFVVVDEDVAYGGGVDFVRHRTSASSTGRTMRPSVDRARRPRRRERRARRRSGTRAGPDDPSRPDVVEVAA